tara:strand:- start:29731 stop:31668 length:1938 start_codon:yes stop_codon:yes gene_type:complete
MAGITTGDQFTLLKASAIAAISADLASTVATSATVASLAAQAAGAPLYASYADGNSASAAGDVYMVQTEPATAVYQKGASPEFLGWLGELLFSDSTELFVSTLTGFLAGQTIRTRKDGHAYEVVSSTPHVETAGGVLLKLLPRGGRYYAAGVGVIAGGANKAANLRALANDAGDAPIYMERGEFDLAGEDFAGVNLVCDGLAWSDNSSAVIYDVGLHRGVTTISVGPTGQISTVNAALNRMVSQRIADEGYITLSVQAGDHDVFADDWSFVAPQKISFIGADMLDVLPTTEDALTDMEAGIADIKARYGTRLTVKKRLNNTSASQGLMISGINEIRKLCFESDPDDDPLDGIDEELRYPLFLGVFREARTGLALPEGSANIDLVSCLRGTWGGQVHNSWVNVRGPCFLGYNDEVDGAAAGGPLRLQGRGAMVDTGEAVGDRFLRLFNPTAGTVNGQAQIGVHVESGELRADNGLDIRGGRTAIFATDDAKVGASNALVANAGAVAVARLSKIEMDGLAATSCDASAINVMEPPAKGEIPQYKALVSAGPGSVITGAGASFGGCKGEVGILALNGGQYTAGGTVPTSFDACEFTGETLSGAALNAMGTMRLRAAVTNAIGTSSVFLRQRKGFSDFTDSTGVTLDVS